MTTTENTDYEVKSKEMKKKQSEASLKWYYKNRERLTQQMRDKFRENEDYRNKIKELNKKNRDKIKDTDEFKEKSKEDNKNYYQQKKAKLMLLEKLQHDLDVLKTQLSIPAH